MSRLFLDFIFIFPIIIEREKKNLPERWLTENPIVTSPVGKTKMSLSKIRTVTLRVIPNDFKRKSPLRNFLSVVWRWVNFFVRRNRISSFGGELFLIYVYVCTHDMLLCISQNSGKLLKVHVSIFTWIKHYVRTVQNTKGACTNHVDRTLGNFDPLLLWQIFTK